MCPLFCRRRLSNPTAENSVPGQTMLLFTLANILDRAEAEGNITSPECRLALLIPTTRRWSLVRSEKNEAKAKYSLSPVSLMLQVSSPDVLSSHVRVRIALCPFPRMAEPQTKTTTTRGICDLVYLS